MQVWEGSARVLLREQNYRLTFTVEPVGHRLSGTLDNRSSGDRFSVTGTLLPVEVGAELTAQISAGESPKLSASILGLGVSGLSLKADALLSGRFRARPEQPHHAAPDRALKRRRGARPPPRHFAYPPQGAFAYAVGDFVWPPP